MVIAFWAMFHNGFTYFLYSLQPIFEPFTALSSNFRWSDVASAILTRCVPLPLRHELKQLVTRSPSLCVVSGAQSEYRDPGYRTMHLDHAKPYIRRGNYLLMLERHLLCVREWFQWNDLRDMLTGIFRRGLTMADLNSDGTTDWANESLMIFWITELIIDATDSLYCDTKIWMSSAGRVHKFLCHRSELKPSVLKSLTFLLDILFYSLDRVKHTIRWS